jgi:hypothetical protein
MLDLQHVSKHAGIDAKSLPPSIQTPAEFNSVRVDAQRYIARQILNHGFTPRPGFDSHVQIPGMIG